MGYKLRSYLYQIFIMCSRVPLPLFFALHTWFVINKKGNVNRWESGKFHNPKPKKSWGNVYLGLGKNNPLTGMNLNPFSPGQRYKSRLLGYLEGKNNSTAHKMISFIESNAKNYPYKNEYVLLGPNSNTFTQWILNRFPESNLKLPWNAIGKSYRKEKRIKLWPCRFQCCLKH